MIKENMLTVTENAELPEILKKLVFSDLICVVDAEQRVVGVIVKKYVLRLAEGSNVKAGDICKRDFVFTTLDSVENDSAKFFQRAAIPLLDLEGKLVTVLRRTPNYTDFSAAQQFELSWWHNVLGSLPAEERGPFGKDVLRNSLTNNRVPEEMQELLIKRSAGRRCIEFGAGPRCGYAPLFHEAKQYTIIEPLADDYQKLRDDFGISTPAVTSFSVGGDVLIPSLIDRCDGVMISQNSLNHTPNWVFYLNNMASYQKKCSLLYLNTQLDEWGVGHFALTNSPNAFLRLVSNLGYRIIHQAAYIRKPWVLLSISIIAEKQ